MHNGSNPAGASMPISPPPGVFNRGVISVLIKGLDRTWRGADGYHSSKLTCVQVLRLYHLMAGGIERPSDLAPLVGVGRRGLEGCNLQRLFLSADNSWWLIKRDYPGIGLPSGHLVKCLRCHSIINTVPCQLCGQSQAFEVVRNEKGRVNQNTPTRSSAAE